MRFGLMLAVFVLNAAAIASILGTRAAAGRKVGWVAVVVLLPFLGAVGWLMMKRRTRGPVTASPAG